MLSEGEHIHNKSLARPILLYRRNVSQICYLNSNSEEQNLATNSFNEQKDKNENSTMNLAKQSSDDFEQNFNNVLMDIKKCHIYGGQYQMESHDHEELYKKVVPKACNATKKLGLTDIPEIESQLKEKLEQYLREEMGQPIKTYGSWKDYVRYFLQMDNTLYDVNKHLYKNGFKFDVYIMEDGQLICQKRVPFNIPVIQVQLSSGEQLELLSLLWLFGSKNLAKANDSGIILLDEPDAHLHPSLVQEVIETIKTKLISKLGIQVIMTTHSPTTVSLAPKDCIYVMTENNMTKEIKIEKAASKRQAIQLLTAEFVHVNLPFRMVFVEARDDKKFYTMIQDKLARERLIASTYPLLFMAVGKHKKRPDSADESGSRMIEKSCRAYVENIVESCVNESDEDQSLREFIFGLVDNDNREDPKLYNIRCLKRYSIENYLYDPIHIYYYLRSKNKAEEMKSEINNHSVTEHPDLLSGFFEKGRAAQLTKVLQIIIDVVSKKLIDAVEKFIKFKNKFEECVKKLESLLTNLENKTETSEKESTIEDFETTCKLVHSEGNLLDYAKKIRERSKCKDVLKELIDLARKVIKAIDNLGSDKNNLIRKREDLEEVYELIKCKEEVSFGNGVMGTLSYPKVILKMRGHDLVTFYTAIYPSLPKFNSEMIAFLTRNQILIPEDLIQIFQSLQKPDVKLQRQYTRNVSREDTEKNNTKLMRRSKEQARQLRDLQNKNEKLTKRNEELRMQKKILNDCLSQVEQEMRSEQSEDVRTNMLRYFSTIREKMTNKEHECNDPEDLTNGQDGIVNGFSV
ncbi:uncharacterized protein TRIADDRAFT_51463 [Trichoplax adhaerens]|uniref:ATPase AAA-type core domain-containing protein n=1 Tax=Trichoplax adhaerens TaxID=10228 RepID=B3RJA2_TRIAD|nr:predicted protein [Trichoplax adhaerens]EDV29295.1 predicted protein [Trichoplax adhaerens]|eukprot:XP_002108497.1 predicted protein [Trichoplax adhaerens]